MNKSYKIVATIAAFLLAFSGLLMPVSADIGGGNVGGGGNSGMGPSGYVILAGDNANNPGSVFGTRQASIKNFQDEILRRIQATDGKKWPWSDNAYIKMNPGFNAAINNATGTNDTNSEKYKNTRVVLAVVAWSQSPGHSKYTTWGANNKAFKAYFEKQWPAVSQSLVGYTDAQKQAVYNEFQKQWKAAGSPIHAVIVALNGDQPNPSGETISITTKASNKTISAGSKIAVHDNVTVKSTDAQNKDTKKMRISLNWGGPNVNSKSAVKSKVKEFNVKTNATTKSPSFTPADFGWSMWPAGKYWFNTSIQKQGKMRADAATLGVDDGAENFTVTDTPRVAKSVTVSASNRGSVDGKVLMPGDSYMANISVRDNGYNSFKIEERVLSKEVFFGAKDKDDLTKAKLYFNGDDATTYGSKQAVAINPSKIKVVETANGRNLVLDHSTGGANTAKSGYWSFQIPVYLKQHAPATVSDQPCLTLGSKAAYCPPAQRKSVIVPRNPVKTWVADNNGALSINKNGMPKDHSGNLFLENDPIAAVVYAEIPRESKLTSYTMTDNWGEAKNYVDFSDPKKVAVYADGKNVTDQFTISVDAKNGKTTATAKKAFLDSISGNKTTVAMKLVLNGKVVKVPDDNKERTVTNKASVNWSGKAIATNSPTTKVIKPPADKAWVLDEEGALRAFDPDHTNKIEADGKKFVPGDQISTVVNAKIPAGKKLTHGLKSFEIVDDWTDAAKYVKFTQYKVFLDTGNGKFVDVSSQFTFSTSKNVTKAVAGKDFLSKIESLNKEARVKFVLTGKFNPDVRTDGKVIGMINAGSAKINSSVSITNEPPVFIETPKPDKVWVLDEKGALSSEDPNWTNSIAADNKVFIPGDKVSAVVNGKIPANLGRNLDSYRIVDDWTQASEYVDFSDASRAKVFVDGTDATDMFNIYVNGTQTIAEAKFEFLTNTAGLKEPRTVKLFISGEFKTDINTHGKQEELKNAGSEKWNNASEETNVPSVFVWTPIPEKDVLASEEQGGDNNSINDKYVFPGQVIEYKVSLDVRIPENSALGVTSFGVEDNYDKNFIPNKSSIKFYDTKKKEFINTKYWDVTWDDANHKFTVTFDKEWVKNNIPNDNTDGWIVMHFDGKVADNVPNGTTLENTAFELLNNSRTQTNIPVVKTPEFDPVKEVLDKTESVDANEGKLLVGEELVYRITLDATIDREEIAYDVHRLGIIDDYDEEYLEILAKNIKVTNKVDGTDVTDKFNIQVKDGKAYIFAKQVDSKNVKGEPVPGEPQPQDLEAYSTAKIDPLKTPIIDQSILNNEYWVTLRASVIKGAKGDEDHEITNQAVQIFENYSSQTNVVRNKVKDIEPTKDVTVEVNGDSIDGGEVPLWSTFNYQLNSSIRPVDLFYDTFEWGIKDKFDPYYDQFTGKWQVYASRDIRDAEGNVIFKKGDLLAEGDTNKVSEDGGNTGAPEADASASPEPSPSVTPSEEPSATHSKTPNADSPSATPSADNAGNTDPAGESDDEVANTDNNSDRGESTVPKEIYFEATFKDNVFEIHATKAYLDLINADKSNEQGWTVFTQMDRVAPGKDIPNVLDETYNNFPRESNRVVTSTPEFPSISLEKFDTESGKDKGDRDRAEDALKLGENKEERSAEISFEITNTGNVPLKDVKLTDETISGSGKVENITPPEAWNGNLAIGETVIFKGTLVGLNLGEKHENHAVVTGKSIFTDKEVSDSDDWHAVTPGIPSIKIEKYDAKGGFPKGDRDDAANALNVKTGESVELIFEVTNDGAVPLNNITVTDQTIEGSGKVENITAPEGFSGTLKPGEKVKFTGTLTGLSDGVHVDKAKVTGTTDGGNEVSDEDPWNAKVSTPTPPAPPHKSLSESGANLLPLIVAFAALGTGGVMVAGSRKKKINEEV